MTDILTQSQIAEKALNNCKFCSKKAKYTCPKCNAPYCSISCYKGTSHMKCSENFYEQLVKQELQATGTTPEAKKKMMEILQRTAEQPDDIIDSDDEDDLADRIKGIDLDDSEALWKCLLPEEQDEFLEMAKGGDVEGIVPPWKPWWNGSASVVELTAEKDSTRAPFAENCPRVVKVPQLLDLSTVKPSKTIPFNIINVISAYTSVTRIFNGDHQHFCVDATESLFCLAPTLSLNANYVSAQIAVTVSKTQMQTHTWLLQDEQFHEIIREDVQSILSGPNDKFPTFYINSALSDIHKMLLSCQKSLMRDVQKSKKLSGFEAIVSSFGEVPKQFVSLKLVKLSVKKIEYYLSYLKQNPKSLSL